MPPPNPKNFGTSAAASDLGLGDLVTQQLEDDTEEKKKKLLKTTAVAPAMSPASIALLGGYGGYGTS